MRTLIALLIPSALLYGCTDDAFTDTGVVTPAGYKLRFQDRGSMALHDVYALFDAAVEDAAVELWRYGVSYERVVAAVKAYTIVGADAFLFRSAWSGTGYATGQIGNGKIILAFYTRQRNADGPVWTHFTWPGSTEVQSGITPKAFGALHHELGHHFFGADFEHGWVPPVVNARLGYDAKDVLAVATCEVMP